MSHRRYIPEPRIVHGAEWPVAELTAVGASSMLSFRAGRAGVGEPARHFRIGGGTRSANAATARWFGCRQCQCCPSARPECRATVPANARARVRCRAREPVPAPVRRHGDEALSSGSWLWMRPGRPGELHRRGRAALHATVASSVSGSASSVASGPRRLAGQQLPVPDRGNNIPRVIILSCPSPRPIIDEAGPVSRLAYARLVHHRSAIRRCHEQERQPKRKTRRNRRGHSKKNGLQKGPRNTRESSRCRDALPPPYLAFPRDLRYLVRS